VEYLATRMLNHALRPLLAAWHPALLAWERQHKEADAEWKDAQGCRDALRDAQTLVTGYARGLGALAGLSQEDIGDLLAPKVTHTETAPAAEDADAR
jgi:hypothetical protein